MQYDYSVRNSENTVVQFTYGDDGLNPDKMENNDRPVDFERLRMQIRETSPCAGEKSLMGQEMIDLVDERLAEKRFQDLLPTGKVFLQEIRDFILGLVDRQKEIISGAHARSVAGIVETRDFSENCKINSSNDSLLK